MIFSVQRRRISTKSICGFHLSWWRKDVPLRFNVVGAIPNGVPLRIVSFLFAKIKKVWKISKYVIDSKGLSGRGTCRIVDVIVSRLWRSNLCFIARRRKIVVEWFCCWGSAFEGITQIVSPHLEGRQQQTRNKHPHWFWTSRGVATGDWGDWLFRITKREKRSAEFVNDPP